MTKKIILIVFVLAVAISFVCNSHADELEFECCCEWMCCYAWYQADKDFFDGDLLGDFENKTGCLGAYRCEDAMEFGYACEPEYQGLGGACRSEVAMAKQKLTDEDHNAIILFRYDSYKDAECEHRLKSGCMATRLFGEDFPELDTLRRFRDDVLSTSITGRNLIEFYYEYSEILIEIFEENPDIKALAKKLLKKAVPVIEAFLDSDGKSELITDGISSDAADLIDEINAVMASPLKETLLGMRKDVMDGALFE